jgi:hypothetical protein
VPPAALIHSASPETRAAVKHALGMGPPPVPTVAPAPEAVPTPKAVPPPEAVVNPASKRALWTWAAATPSTTLFFTDDFEFRLRTRRAITGSFKDGAFMFLAGSGPLAAWYALEQERIACRAAHGGDCWFALARRLGADYAVLDPGLAVAAAAPPPDFEQIWARDGWSVWRRRGA